MVDIVITLMGQWLIKYVSLIKLRVKHWEVKKHRQYLCSIKLSLTTTYNPEANGKVERGHGTSMKALVKACHGRIWEWPHLFPYVLWVDRTTHSIVTRYMSGKLIFRQKPVMLIEQTIALWLALPWQDEMTREDLLALRIQQLEWRPEDIEIAKARLKELC